MSLSKTNRRLSALVLGLTVSGFAAVACSVAATSAPATQTGATQTGATQIGATQTGANQTGASLTPASGSAAPVRCELVLDEARGATTIEGRVSAERPVSGTYRLSIASRSAGGSATINQSGDFAARPGAPAVLGQTTLGGVRANYRADLELNVAGQRLTCSEARGVRDL